MEQKREFTGVWIPKHIIEDPDLSAIEKMFYAEIACFEVCYLKNSQLGERYKKSEETVRQIIRKLKKKGYIIMTQFNGRLRGLVALKDLQITRQGGENSPGRVVKNNQAGGVK